MAKVIYIVENTAEESYFVMKIVNNLKEAKKIKNMMPELKLKITKVRFSRYELLDI